MSYVRLWEKRDKRKWWNWHTEEKHRLTWGFRVRYSDGRPFPIQWQVDNFDHRCHRSRSGPRRRNS